MSDSNSSFGLARTGRALVCLLMAGIVSSMPGCGVGKTAKKKQDFFTSGSREADQRATQRMAKEEQLAGSGEGAGEKKAKQAKKANGTNAVGAQVETKLALFDRLGGEAGISNIVADFMPRALNDPRVNWARKEAKRGIFGGDKISAAWNPTPENVAILSTHLVQFLSLATGGPAHYEGKEMKAAHAGMKIANPEFDATVGDLKATLDKLRVPNKEQKELIAIIESTRPQIVTER